MNRTIAATAAAVGPADPAVAAAVWARQHDLLKPHGSLGELERIAAEVASGVGEVVPAVEPVAVAVFAADHGVHAQGVSRWPQEVTAQMVAAVLGGDAAVSVLARRVGARVRVVDVGVAHLVGPDHPDLRRQPVAPGTADFTTGPAMSRAQAEQAVQTGVEVADELVDEGFAMLATGDLGIANTTASAALVCAFTGAAAADATGRGAGVDNTGWLRKVQVVRTALERHRPDPGDPIGVLAAVGGFEHAALTGFLLGAAARRVPVVLDGVIAGSAALAARSLAPHGPAHWLAGHRSQEPAATIALDALGLTPVLDLGMRLGEGTGAILAVPVVQSAVAILREMATFSGLDLSRRYTCTGRGPTPGAHATT